jgi:hypothetical protein
MLPSATSRNRGFCGRLQSEFSELQSESLNPVRSGLCNEVSATYSRSAPRTSVFVIWHSAVSMWFHGANESSSFEPSPPGGRPSDVPDLGFGVVNFSLWSRKKSVMKRIENPMNDSRWYSRHIAFVNFELLALLAVPALAVGYFFDSNGLSAVVIFAQLVDVEHEDVSLHLQNHCQRLLRLSSSDEEELASINTKLGVGSSFSGHQPVLMAPVALPGLTKNFPSSSYASNR